MECADLSALFAERIQRELEAIDGQKKAATGRRTPKLRTYSLRYYQSVYNGAPPKMKTPTPTLVRALIGKSIAETLLVGALAVFTFMTVLPPYFHGWGEVTTTGISGWAVNNAAPWDRCEVQLFIDGRFYASAVAHESRPDVVAAGWARDEWHGYTFAVKSLPAGTYVARVYVLHASGGGVRKSLQLLGDPILFTVGSDGELRRRDWSG